MKIYIVTKYIDYANYVTCVDSVYRSLENAEKRAKEIEKRFNDIEVFNIEDY